MADQMQILKWARTLGSILPLQAPNLHSVKLAPFCSAAETSTLWSLHLCSFVLVVKKLRGNVDDTFGWQQQWPLYIRFDGDNGQIWGGSGAGGCLGQIGGGELAFRLLNCFLPLTCRGCTQSFYFSKNPQKNLVLSLLEIFLLLHSAY